MKLKKENKKQFIVRNEEILSEKNISSSILFLSDFHFNKQSQEIALEIILKIELINPEIILFGGDYVDSKKGVEFLELILKSVSNRKNVYAISGNHDKYFGLDIIKNIFIHYGIVWLEDVSYEIKQKNIIISNNPMEKSINKDKLNVLLLHNPKEAKKSINGFDIVLAGHLHGGQIVLWQTKKGMYPGRLLYSYNFLRKTIRNTVVIVSRGLGDTLPIRYNCPKELINIKIL